MSVLPVTCSKCGKPFQVPEAALGQSAVCPWCQADVLALPLAQTAAPEPLSLDDDPPASPGRTLRSLAVQLVLGVLLLTVVFGIAFVAARSGTGWVPEFGWVAFEAPDGSCRAELLAAAIGPEVYEPIPDFPMTRPGQRFQARGGYSKVAMSVGWIDVDREKAKLLRLEDIAGGEMARRKKELQATSTTSSNRKRNNREGLEVRYQTPSGVVVDRMIYIGEGTNPRLYVLSHSTPVLREGERSLERFFDSFQLK